MYIIHLKKQITQMTVSRALCAFISENVVDFATINVATSFRKLFQVPSTRPDKEQRQ
jgi:hypothetical protein